MVRGLKAEEGRRESQDIAKFKCEGIKARSMVDGTPVRE